ncbi:MAG: hypothetical protein NT090_00050, partial [Acidobacteria bacterium]|nr:hypothetical protein [Acidobacteriota bacterium]
MEHWPGTAELNGLVMDFAHIPAVGKDFRAIFIPGKPLSGIFQWHRRGAIGEPSIVFVERHLHGPHSILEGYPILRSIEC